MQNLIEKIKRQKWFEGVGRKDKLLIYSLENKGEDEYIRKEHGKRFIQARILIPKKESNVRIIGFRQAKIFHSESKKQILKNPQLLIDKIEEDGLLLNDLIKKSKKLKDKKGLLEIIELFKRHSYVFFLCFSFGLQLFRNKKKIKNKKLIRRIFKYHDKWRNSVAEKEKKIIKNLYPYFGVLLKEVGLDNVKDIFYLEIGEFERGLKRGFSKNIKNKVDKRKNGYGYIFLDGVSRVVENEKILEKLKALFDSKKRLPKRVIKGKVAYKARKKIKGRVKIINNPNKVGKILKGTILVSVQISTKSSRNFIPIIKRFSAIVVDEGGITSHAAIISREFKIPCIVNTKIATQVLKDGDLVEVDTEKGVVKIII